ncbi:MAG: hypothetical protein JO154_04110 [Chitinophaga sp.]|uniref:hypothetical protein n=1 Tax=Chitinophaga sp. TaxID=1869181 RepID=UPI0025BCF094|nr:hypothetical protein [Chitinophaga sp.]MBV8251770.1 hypothetical protein [Chitinophaga sp.]
MRIVLNCFALLLVICLFSINGDAQVKTNALYRTPADYVKGITSYGPSAANPGKLKLHLLAPKDYVDLSFNGNNSRIPVSQLFGYATIEGKVFCIHGGDTYEVMNKNARLLLYRKRTLSSNREYRNDRYSYYFSTADGVIHPLTSMELKAAFPDKHDWADLLDTNFKHDNELMAYDSYHHMYKLEWLLK